MRKVRFVHIALLSESPVYLLVALLLKTFSGFTGFARSSTSGIHPVVGVQIFLLLLFPILALALAAGRKFLFAKDFLASPGATVQQISRRYIRMQVMLDALAGAPAIIGFVLFLLNGSYPLLFVYALFSMLLLALLFPRERHLTTVLEQINGGAIAI